MVLVFRQKRKGPFAGVGAAALVNDAGINAAKEAAPDNLKSSLLVSIKFICWQDQDKAFLAMNRGQGTVNCDQPKANLRLIVLVAFSDVVQVCDATEAAR